VTIDRDEVVDSVGSLSPRRLLAGVARRLLTIDCEGMRALDQRPRHTGGMR